MTKQGGELRYFLAWIPWRCPQLVGESWIFHETLLLHLVDLR